MTLEEIKQQYPNEWALIEFSALDENLDLIDGIVIAHAVSHGEHSVILTEDLRS